MEFRIDRGGFSPLGEVGRYSLGVPVSLKDTVPVGTFRLT